MCVFPLILKSVIVIINVHGFSQKEPDDIVRVKVKRDMPIFERNIKGIIVVNIKCLDDKKPTPDG